MKSKKLSIRSTKSEEKNHYSYAIKSSIPIFLSIVGVFASILSMYTEFGNYDKGKNSLTTQISEVELAVKNLKNLEQYLDKIKTDMIVTNEARIKIEEEYKKAKSLEKLTDVQLETLSRAVNRKTIADIIMNYVWGFVLGIGSSMIATFIYSKRWKKVPMPQS